MASNKQSESKGKALGKQAEVFIKQADDLSLPYSATLLSHSLMATGLDPAASYGVAKELELSLRHKGIKELDHDQLRDEVIQYLEASMGDIFSQRYRLIHELKSSDKPVVILIGGAPGVGKSTVAYELAYRLGIQRVVSSDAVREALRSLISPELSPTLHLSSFTAWQADLLPDEPIKPKRKRVMRAFQSQVQQLAKALTGIIERYILEGESVILEGAHLVPGALDIQEIKDASILELVFHVQDETQHKTHFSLRDEQTGHKRIQQRYLNHFEEIRLIQTFIMERAAAEGVAMIQTLDLDESIHESLILVLDSMLGASTSSKK